ncbi:uncharacterized protein LOC102656452 [Apis mellifera]|uniref:Uncharacterized protein LOC102656452 n=1 Tax=Apis mellifera TaxID=7460 RepID=A0A7M7GXC8_APIME|nr:uncharacterized protein LOC102656452 [Apis mellifera]|eukprot:XP_006565110.2 uncharacterized protein LOC102656452 [Apis mellifera]
MPHPSAIVGLVPPLVHRTDVYMMEHRLSGGQVEGRKNGRNVRRVVTGGRRPVDDTFPAGRPLGASLPLGRGQYCGRGPLVTRYMATKDMDRRAASEQLAFVTRTIDDTNRHGIRANYDSPWAHLCPGIDDESPPCLRQHFHFRHNDRPR